MHATAPATAPAPNPNPNPDPTPTRNPNPSPTPKPKQVRSRTALLRGAVADACLTLTLTLPLPLSLTRCVSAWLCCAARWRMRGHACSSRRSRVRCIGRCTEIYGDIRRYTEIWVDAWARLPKPSLAREVQRRAP